MVRRAPRAIVADVFALILGPSEGLSPVFCFRRRLALSSGGGLIDAHRFHWCKFWSARVPYSVKGFFEGSLDEFAHRCVGGGMGKMGFEHFLFFLGGSFNVATPVRVLLNLPFDSILYKLIVR